MATIDVPAIIRGLTGGVNSEKTKLNILPTELEDTSRNIQTNRDGSLQPRKGVDFVGQSDSGNYLHSVRTSASSAETNQESPSGIYADFRTSDGEIVEKTIIFQDLEFKIFDHNNLRNFDSPNQLIEPVSDSRINTEQLYYNVSMVFADNKVFFAGRKLQPGYLYLDSDNDTLNIVYLSVHTRDLDNATAASSRVQLNGKYYECIEAHTASATDITSTDSYGELIFNRYWMELDNTSIPGGTPTWTAGNSYTTNIQRTYSKYSTLSDNNPYGVTFWDNRLWLMDDSKVYYSQIAVDIEDAKTSTTPTGTHEYSLFLQEADPFSTVDPDPQGSDGGTVTPDSGKLWQILATEDSVFIGTSSQIEEIRGASQYFSHTDFKKERVINEGINGVDNMVAADNRIYVFANNNIWAAMPEARFNQATPTKFGKVANKKIKDYYISIPKLNKGTARAVYSPTKDKIYYFHNATSLTFDAQNRSIVGQNGYASSILIIDISATTPDVDASRGNETFLQSQIEIWDYATDAHTGTIYMAYGFSAAPTTPSFNSVIAGADDVVVGSDSVIVSGLSGSQEGSDEIVIIAMKREISGADVLTSTSIGVLESLNLKDWASDATYTVNYNCNADFGTQVLEDLTTKQSRNYLVYVFEKLTTGTGSCLARHAYNFSSPTSAGEATGKTSSATEVYKDTRTIGEGGSVSMSNYDYTFYKQKVRGRGIAYQLSLSNTPGKDFVFAGWGQMSTVKRRG